MRSRRVEILSFFVVVVEINSVTEPSQVRAGEKLSAVSEAIQYISPFSLQKWWLLSIAVAPISHVFKFWLV